MDDDMKKDVHDISDFLHMIGEILEQDTIALHDLVKMKNYLESGIGFLDSIIEVQVVREINDLEEGP